MKIYSDYYGEGDFICCWSDELVLGSFEDGLHYIFIDDVLIYEGSVQNRNRIKLLQKWSKKED